MVKLEVRASAQKIFLPNFEVSPRADKKSEKEKDSSVLSGKTSSILPFISSARSLARLSNS